jgi:hypothetical protein
VWSAAADADAPGTGLEVLALFANRKKIDLSIELRDGNSCRTSLLCS